MRGSLEFIAPEGKTELDHVETTNAIYHISPPIQIKPGTKYRFEIYPDGFLFWECLADSTISREAKQSWKH